MFKSLTSSENSLSITVLFVLFFYLVCAQDGLCPLTLRDRFRFLGYKRRLDRKIIINRDRSPEVHKRADGVTPLLRASVL